VMARPDRRGRRRHAEHLLLLQLQNKAFVTSREISWRVDALSSSTSVNPAEILEVLILVQVVGVGIRAPGRDSQRTAGTSSSRPRCPVPPAMRTSLPGHAAL